MGEQVFYKDMPCHLKGFTKKNDDESFTIFINAKHNKEQQLATYQHEIRHIRNGDFNNRELKSADVIEFRNHKIHRFKIH